jgi:hypothetical protein
VPLAVAEADYTLELRGIDAYSVEAEIVLATFSGRTGL